MQTLQILYIANLKHLDFTGLDVNLFSVNIRYNVIDMFTFLTISLLT